MREAQFHWKVVCGMHGFIRRVYAECTISPIGCVRNAERTVPLEGCVRNARFYQKGVCGMHGFTDRVCAECTVSSKWCAECTVSLEWCVQNRRFHRDGMCGMHDFAEMVLNVCFPISRTFSSRYVCLFYMHYIKNNVHVNIP